MTLIYPHRPGPPPKPRMIACCACGAIRPMEPNVIRQPTCPHDNYPGWNEVAELAGLYELKRIPTMLDRDPS